LRLAIGLGNPGSSYTFTRHNLGFRVIETLSRRLDIILRTTEGPCLLGTGRLDDLPVGLALPSTYMNESGRAVAFLRNDLNLVLSDLLVICDDVNLPRGKIRLRRGGSDGGHRGLASVITKLAAEDFPRLRLGIGAPPGTEDLIEYVLEEFEQPERESVDAMIEQAADTVLSYFREGIETAMNRFNA
jgi:PTH1 family peptidyl-tRNA hydrolase